MRFYVPLFSPPTRLECSFQNQLSYPTLSNIPNHDKCNIESWNRRSVHISLRWCALKWIRFNWFRPQAICLFWMILLQTATYGLRTFWTKYERHFPLLPFRTSLHQKCPPLFVTPLAHIFSERHIWNEPHLCHFAVQTHILGVGTCTRMHVYVHQHGAADELRLILRHSLRAQLITF